MDKNDSNDSGQLAIPMITHVRQTTAHVRGLAHELDFFGHPSDGRIFLILEVEPGALGKGAPPDTVTLEVKASS